MVERSRMVSEPRDIVHVVANDPDVPMDILFRAAARKRRVINGPGRGLVDGR
jgi:hypothetical protein